MHPVNVRHRHRLFNLPNILEQIQHPRLHRAHFVFRWIIRRIKPADRALSDNALWKSSLTCAIVRWKRSIYFPPWIFNSIDFWFWNEKWSLFAINAQTSFMRYYMKNKANSINLFFSAPLFYTYTYLFFRLDVLSWTADKMFVFFIIRFALNCCRIDFSSLSVRQTQSFSSNQARRFSFPSC